MNPSRGQLRGQPRRPVWCDLCAPHVERLEIVQSGEMLQPLVGNAGAVEIEVLEMREGSHRGKVPVLDVRAFQV